MDDFDDELAEAMGAAAPVATQGPAEPGQPGRPGQPTPDPHPDQHNGEGTEPHGGTDVG
jgi:hypothetical protein